LQVAETTRSAHRPTSDLTAYDLYLRALAAFYPVTRERLVTALGLIEQAIAIDSHYGLALAWAAVCHLRLLSEGWAEEPETNRRKSIDFARQALQAGENDPGVLANPAITLTQFGEDIGAMIGLVDRALTLNPSFARGWFRSGLIRIYAGEHDLAIEHLETSLRLSPRERVGAPLQWIGMACFFKRHFDEAAAKLLFSIQENPGSPTPYRALAACYAHMGRLDEARATIAKVRALTPLVSPANLPYRNPEDRELLLSGLRIAIGEVYDRHPPSRRDPRRRCGGVFAADGDGRGRYARTPQGSARRTYRSEDHRTPWPHHQDHRRWNAVGICKRRRCGPLRGRGHGLLCV
jgi:adenylate cyclase